MREGGVEEQERREFKAFCPRFGVLSPRRWLALARTCRKSAAGPPPECFQAHELPPFSCRTEAGRWRSRPSCARPPRTGAGPAPAFGPRGPPRSPWGERGGDEWNRSWSGACGATHSCLACFVSHILFRHATRPTTTRKRLASLSSVSWLAVDTTTNRESTRTLPSQKPSASILRKGRVHFADCFAESSPESSTDTNTKFVNSFSKTRC